MSWNQIENIEINNLKNNVLPVRIILTRSNGNKVYAGGTDLCEATQTLFSTAGFGRPDAPVLAGMISDRLKDKVNHFVLNNMITALLLKEE